MGQRMGKDRQRVVVVANAARGPDGRWSALEQAEPRLDVGREEHVVEQRELLPTRLDDRKRQRDVGTRVAAALPVPSTDPATCVP